MELYGGTNKAEVWRDKTTKWFKNQDRSVKVVNPTDYYTYGKNYHKTDKEVFRFDLHKVKHSDLILVNLNDIRKSIGTTIEVHEAYRRGIPVIGFIYDELPIDELIQLVHPWIYECCTRIESGKDSLERALIHIKDYYLD